MTLELRIETCPSSGRSHMFRCAAALRQPRGVRAGHEPVLGTVDEQDGGAYLPGVTAPGGDVGQVVVHYPALVGCQGLGGHGP